MPDNGQRGRTAVDAWLDGGAPDRTGADLRAVEPLGFSTFTKLDLPADSAQKSTELLVSGARYGDAWAVGVQLELGGVLLGEIRTEVSSEPDRALASALAWVEEYCESSGLAVTQAENLSDQFPSELRPFQIRARFLVVPRAGVS
ncbi:hypothetical protein OG241_03590 [Streptomyces sp. NBC_01390]|uniref:hypothetical protein n=1 Tax=Streptomyces sp. NBC_01390 TaxID=2903850 RepID=UPI003249C9D8